MTLFFYCAACGIVVIHYMLFLMMLCLTSLTSTTLGQINRYIFKAVSVLLMVTIKVLAVPIIQVLFRCSDMTQSAAGDRSSGLLSLFVALSAIVLLLFGLVCFGALMFFRNDDPQLELPWSQITFGSAFMIFLSKVGLALLLLIDSSDTSTLICLVFTAATAALSAYFLLAEPAPLSKTVMFFHLFIASILLSNAFCLAIAKVYTYVPAHPVCVASIGVLVTLLLWNAKKVLVHRRLRLMVTSEDALSCKELVESTRVLFEAATLMKRTAAITVGVDDEVAKLLVTEFLIAHCRVCSFPVCPCQKLIGKLLKHADTEGAAPDSPRSPSKPSRKLSKANVSMSYTSDSTFKSFEKHIGSLLLKLLNHRIANSTLTESERAALRLESAYRQEGDEGSLSASLLLNAAHDGTVTFQQDFFVYCKTQQVLTQLEHTVRREEEESKMARIIKQQQLFMNYIEAVNKIATKFMLFWAQLQKETPDMHLILSRGTEIADLLVRVGRQREEIEKWSNESIKINVIYALMLNNLLHDHDGARFFHKLAMQNMDQRYRIGQAAEELQEKTYGCNSDCGVAILNELGEIENCNKEFEVVFGYTKSELRTVVSLAKLMPSCVGKWHNAFMKEQTYLQKDKINSLNKELTVMAMNSAGFLIPINLIRKVLISKTLTLRFVVLVKLLNNVAAFTDDPNGMIPQNRALAFALSKNMKIVGMNATALRVLGFDTDEITLWRYLCSTNKFPIWNIISKELVEVEPITTTYFSGSVNLRQLQKKLAKYLLDSIKEGSKAISVLAQESMQDSLDAQMNIWIHPRTLVSTIGGKTVEIKYYICIMTLAEQFQGGANQLLMSRLAVANMEQDTNCGKNVMKAAGDAGLFDDMHSVSSTSG